MWRLQSFELSQEKVPRALGALLLGGPRASFAQELKRGQQRRICPASRAPYDAAVMREVVGAARLLVPHTEDGTLHLPVGLSERAREMHNHGAARRVRLGRLQQRGAVVR